MDMYRLFFLIGFLGFYSLAYSQNSFYNGTQQVLGSQSINSTVPIAIDDINGDQKDDIILFDQGKLLKTFVQNGVDKPFTYQMHTQTSAFGDLAVVTGDLDNDGTPEIVASGNENGSEILFAPSGLYSTVQITPPVFSQNTNLVDYNNDGFLDLFVCNDVGENQTYINDGTGKLNRETIIDFQTSEEDDMSGNYSSIFTDIDSDGDLDLYIGKCRAGVTDPTDPRRVNTLYINNGDGSYTEDAQSFGLDNGAQSWSVDAGDVDNDGDIDMIVANHDRAHDLMINDGNGNFSRFGELPEESKSFAYQSFFADFDNNGWLDIFITEPSNSYILYNNQMVFSQYDLSQGGSGAFSAAAGDFNSDGWLDLYLGFGDSFQVAGNRSDIILINEGGSHNYLNVNLIGSVSNKDAIGAKVTIYTSEDLKVREVIAGRSYGIMNSTVSRFGLGDIELVDSIKVDWPSGNRSVITNAVETNTTLTISEDGCITRQLLLSDLELCDGGPVVVRLDEDYSSYNWSDGSEADSLKITQPGTYSVLVEKDGCTVRSNTFEVVAEQPHLSDELVYVDSYFGCIDQELKLETISGSAYEWSSGESKRSIYVTESGYYQVSVSTNCDTYVSDSIYIDMYTSDVPEIIEDTVLMGESATLSLLGDDVSWYRELRDQFTIAEGSTLITGPLMRDSVFYAGDRWTDLGFQDELLSPVPLNSNFDDQFVGNDTLDFKVLSPFRLKSIAVRADVSGQREIEIWKKGNLIFSALQEMEVGINKVNIDEILEIGDYQLTTDEQLNIQQLGQSDPGFSYSEQFFGNDKIQSGYLKIGESRLYENVIPYFFEWNVNYAYFSCENRYPVIARISEDVSTDDIDTRFNIYPNPSDGNFYIDSEVEVSLGIYAMDGRLVVSSDKFIGEYNLNHRLPTGSYMIRLTLSNRVYSKLIMIK
jgi:hypothetical protein